MEEAKKKGKIFYGYFVVAGLFLIVFVCVTFGMTTMGTHYAGLAEQIGTDKVMISQWTVFVGIGTMVTLPFTGQWIRRTDVRIPVTVAIVLQAAIFFAISFVTNLYLFYACAVGVGVAMGILMNLMTAIVCSRWFTTKAATMIGIVFAASGVGGIVFNPMVAYLIKEYGASFDYRVEAILILVIALPSALFLLRSRPADMGLEPQQPKAGETTTEKEEAASAGNNAKAVFKNPSFYVYAFVAFGSGCLMYGYQMTASMITTLPIHETMPLLGGTVMSFASAGQTLGKIGLGYAADKNPVLAYGIVLVCGVCGYMGYCFVNDTAMAWYVTGFLVGITAACTNVLVPAQVKAMYGLKDYESIWSIVAVINKAGGLCQSMIFGAVIALFGYVVFYEVFSVFLGAIFLCSLGSWALSKKLRANWTTKEQDEAALKGQEKPKEMAS